MVLRFSVCVNVSYVWLWGFDTTTVTGVACDRGERRVLLWQGALWGCVCDYIVCFTGFCLRLWGVISVSVTAIVSACFFYLVLCVWLSDWMTQCAVLWESICLCSFRDYEESKSTAIKRCVWPLCVPDRVLMCAWVGLCVCSVCDWILFKTRWSDSVALTW